MKNIILSIMVLMGLMIITGNKSDSDPAKWSNKKIEKWFATKEWSSGWKISPDASVDKKEFAISYFKNKERWEKAFKFLAGSDLSKLENMTLMEITYLQRSVNIQRKMKRQQILKHIENILIYNML